LITYGVHQKHPGGSHQINPHPASLEGQQHDGGRAQGRVRELLHCSMSLFHGHTPIQSYKAKAKGAVNKENYQSDNTFILYTLELWYLEHQYLEYHGYQVI
jgi:hypothetical protein